MLCFYGQLIVLCLRESERKTAVKTKSQNNKLLQAN